MLAAVLQAAALPARTLQADPPAAAGEPARPLEAWLVHEDSSVRALQAFELRRREAPGAVAACTQALAREGEPRVLLLLLGALAAREREVRVREGGAPLAEALLALLGHPQAPVRSDALALLARLPPRPLGADAARLRGWWTVGRGALLDEQARLRAAAAAPPTPPPATAEGATVETRLPLLGPVLTRLARDGLELVLVIDATGSMGPVLAAAKAQCRALARRLALVVPRVRLGLVTYDDAARVRVPLTPDVALLEQGLAHVVAAGGGDLEEGVDKGLRLALQQEAVGWSRRALRHVVLVGDAPPHEGDVRPLLQRLAAAGEDDLFEHPVVVHALGTDPQGVPHVGAIAQAGRGRHLTLAGTARLADEIALLPFGAQHRALAEAWLDELLRLEERLEAGR
ncbi:MAG: vWA domain-containing protein [Planctomycetia bacterium]